MNEVSEDVFFDTDTFPTEAEDIILRTFDTTPFMYIPDPDKLCSDTKDLIRKGILVLFYTHDGGYIFPKGNGRARSVSIEFKAYFAKLGKAADGTIQYLSEEEKDKVAFSRGFISRWVFLRAKITDEDHRDFLMRFTNRISYTISIPGFLQDSFQKEIDKTGMDYSVLTPEYTTVKCPYCRCEFDTKLIQEFTTCPDCKEEVLIR